MVSKPMGRIPSLSNWADSAGMLSIRQCGEWQKMTRKDFEARKHCDMRVYGSAADCNREVTPASPLERLKIGGPRHIGWLFKLGRGR